jgi:hypothetical protein
VQTNLLNDLELSGLVIFKKAIGQTQIAAVLDTQNSGSGSGLFIPAFYGATRAEFPFSEVDNSDVLALGRVMH